VLNEVLRQLDYERLKEVSHEERMGCPFNANFNGPKKRPRRPTLFAWHKPGHPTYEEEQLCLGLCAALFTTIKETSMCPCFNHNSAEVKITFWRALDKAQGKEGGDDLE